MTTCFKEHRPDKHTVPAKIPLSTSFPTPHGRKMILLLPKVFLIGAGDGNRTRDLLHGKQTFYR